MFEIAWTNGGNVIYAVKKKKKKDGGWKRGKTNVPEH